MTSLVPFDDARTLLKAANLVPSTNLFFSNEPYDEPQSSNWLSVEAYSYALDMMDIGANHWAEKGTIIIFCCAPFGTGTDSLRTLAKAVCNVFRGLPARNPYYEGASIGTGGMSDPALQGSYYVIPVSVSFVYEDTADYVYTYVPPIPSADWAQSLPTTLPNASGILWNNGGFLALS